MKKLPLFFAVGSLVGSLGCSAAREPFSSDGLSWPSQAVSAGTEATEAKFYSPVRPAGFATPADANDPTSLAEPVASSNLLTTQQLTLEEVEAIAIANNPTLQAAMAAKSKAANLREQVGTRPNPTLGYFGQQLANRNTDQYGLYVEQEFVRGNKLALNREVLGYTEQAQAAELETQRLRVLTDVRTRFFEAAAAQRELAAILDFQVVANQGVQVAEARQRADEGSLIETLQARTLASEVGLAAEQAEVAFRGAWQDLAAVAGLPLTAPTNLVADFAMAVRQLDWETTVAEILVQSPEVATAESLVCEKQAILQRERAQVIPNLTAQVGVGQDRSTNHGMVNLQLSAPLPVFNRNTGNIAAAQSELLRATQEVERVKQSIRSRLARARQEYEVALAAVSRYEREIIPQAKQSLELSELAYRSGELDFLQVLIVRRSYYEATVRSIQAQGHLAQASAKVDGQLLSGGLDSPFDFTNGDGLRGASFGGQ